MRNRTILFFLCVVFTLMTACTGLMPEGKNPVRVVFSSVSAWLDTGGSVRAQGAQTDALLCVTPDETGPSLTLEAGARRFRLSGTDLAAYTDDTCTRRTILPVAPVAVFRELLGLLEGGGETTALKGCLDALCAQLSTVRKDSSFFIAYEQLPAALRALCDWCGTREGCQTLGYTREKDGDVIRHTFTPSDTAALRDTCLTILGSALSAEAVRLFAAVQLPAFSIRFTCDRAGALQRVEWKQGDAVSF